MVLVSSSGGMDKGRPGHLAPKMLARKDVFVMTLNYVSSESDAGLLLKNEKTGPK
jgi:hypothetical protein